MNPGNDSNNQKAYQIFSSFKSKYYDDKSETTQESESLKILDIDEEMKIIIQRINKKSKKSTTTRSKALQKMHEMLREKPAEYFEALAKLFIIVFEKLVTSENDPTVLTALQKCLEIFIERGDKALKRNFGLLFPYIFLSSFDLNRDVALAAKSNLQLLLKDDAKVAKGLFMFREKYAAMLGAVFGSPEQFVKDMSIYDEKEVNDVIFRKLLAMLWWSAARALQLSGLLPKDEQDKFLEPVFQICLNSEEPLVLKMFVQYKNDYVIRTALLNFLNALFTEGLTERIEKPIVKKIIQAVVVINLDDPNISFQAFLWKNGFAVKLLQTARSLKMDLSSAKKRVLVLLENHAFGVEKDYYDNIGAALEVLTEGEKPSAQQAFFKEAIMAHFTAVLKDDLRLEVGLHYKTGFGLIKGQLAKIQGTLQENGKQQTAFEGLQSIFVELSRIFCEHNNSLQKNLNALSVNNIKHFPNELCQFFEEASIISEIHGFYEKFAENFEALFANSFDKKLDSKNSIANLGIFLKYICKHFLKHLGTEGKKNYLLVNFYQQIILKCTNQFEKAYEKILGSLEDISFAKTAKCLESLTVFSEEVFDSTFKKIQEAEEQKSSELKTSLDKLFAKFKTDFIELNLNDKIDNLLLDQSHKEKFIFWQNDFIKTFSHFADFGSIMESFGKGTQTYSNVQLYEKFWRKLLYFLLEKSVARKIPDFEKIFDEGEPRNLQILNELKQAKEFPFNQQLMKFPQQFKFLFEQIIKVFLYKNQFQFALSILNFSQISPISNIDELIRVFSEYWSSENIDFRAPIESFKMKILASIFPLTSQEQFKLAICQFESVIRKMESFFAEIAIEEFVEDVMALEKNKLIYSFEILFNNAIDAENFSLNTKKLLKVFSKGINQADSQNFNKPLEKIFAELLLKIFSDSSKEKLQSEKIDVLRISLKHLKSLNFQNVFKIAFDHPEFESKVRLHSIVLIASQPSSIYNYTANKKRSFWSLVVYSELVGFIVELFNSRLVDFEALFELMFDQAIKSSYLIVFVKRLLKQIFKDESLPSQNKNQLFLFLLSNFVRVLEIIKAEKDKQIFYRSFQSLALNYKEIMTTIPLSQLIGKEQWLDWQAKLQNDCFGIFALTGKLINTKIHFQETKIIEEDQTKTAENSGGVSQLVDQAKEIAAKTEVRAIGLTLFLELIGVVLEWQEEAILAVNIEPLEAFLSEILQMAEANFSSPFSQNCFYQFLILIRKLMKVLEMFSEEFKASVLRRISKNAFFLSRHAKDSQAVEFWTVPPEEFFSEIAETISRFALRENSEVSIGQVFQVLEIDINALKKSAFYLLQQFQKPFEVDRQIIEAVALGDKSSEGLLVSLPENLRVIIWPTEKRPADFFSYLLYWTFLLRLCNGQTEANRSNFAFLSTVFNDKPEIFMALLNNVFGFFKAKKMNERETFGLLDRTDFLVPENHWGDFISEQAKDAFGVHLIFLFASQFPKSLRKWLEEQKKLANIAAVFLTYKINQAIFAREIEKIELSQHEWKSFEFDIFVNQNTREISAVFQKDDNRLKITLRVPDNYPLKLIEVSMSKEAQNAQIRPDKWVLNIKRLLTNQNYSIVDALVMWKNSLEKEFEGIEECAICYSIFHATTKKLPIMPCKTCKKKFHKDCIYKWFQTSAKSECPLCKSQFL